MVNGDHGLFSPNAMRHVERPLKPVNENATNQNLFMEARCVKGLLLKFKNASWVVAQVSH